MYCDNVYTSILKSFAVMKRGSIDYSADNYCMTAAVLIHVHVVGTMQTGFAGSSLFASFPYIKNLTSG